jgi:hypothetical protein
LSYIARYDKGDWIALCDVCGRKYKASNLKKRWDGLMCCDDDWEIRQPQDFVRGIADTQIAPWLRSEPSNSFVAVTQALLGLFSSVSNATLNVLAIYAPYNLKITSSVTATVTYIQLNTPSTPESINGSPINTITLG